MIKKESIFSLTSVKIYFVIALIIVLCIGSTLFFYFHSFGPLTKNKEVWGIFGTFFGSIAGVMLSSFTFIIISLSYFEQIKDKKISCIENDIQKNIDLCEKILSEVVIKYQSKDLSDTLNLYNALMVVDIEELKGNTREIFKSNILRILSLLVIVELKFSELKKIGKDATTSFGYHYYRHLMKVMNKWIMKQKGNCVLDTFNDLQSVIEYVDVKL